MTKIKIFYFNDIRVCSYIVWDETEECIIIDPGCYSAGEKNRLVKFIEENSLNPVKIFLTHGHFDHLMGCRFVADKWKIKTFIHPNDKDNLVNAKKYCAMFGLDIEEPPFDTEDLAEGKTISFGNTVFEVIHTPGHTQGGVCFYNKKDGIIFTGDTLFAGSIGRTDMPGGNYEQLIDSINKKISVLDPDTKVLPGHGPQTTISYELKTNPFLQP